MHAHASAIPTGIFWFWYKSKYTYILSHACTHRITKHCCSWGVLFCNILDWTADQSQSLNSNGCCYLTCFRNLATVSYICWTVRITSDHNFFFFFFSSIKHSWFCPLLIYKCCFLNNSIKRGIFIFQFIFFFLFMHVLKAKYANSLSILEAYVQ